jgi:hypothetical protein
VKSAGPTSETRPTPRHPDEIGPGPLRFGVDRIARCVAGWRDSEFVSPDLLEVTANALALQAKWAPRLADLVRPDLYPVEEARAHLALGEHLVRESSLQLVGAPWIELIDEAIELAAFTSDEIRAAMAAWRDRLAADAELVGELVRLNIARPRILIDQAIAASGVSREAFWFVFHQIGACALQPAASALAPLVEDGVWKRGHCPICGNEPDVAGLTGDGVRHLVCGVCSFVWTFARGKCPYCGNEDVATLKTLAVNEQTPYRLDACEACKRYLKTVDFRKADAGRAVVLPVDDAATVHLDVMAAKKEYSRE